MREELRDERLGAPPVVKTRARLRREEPGGLHRRAEELAKLKERGLLSDADFEAKKKQILGI